MTNFFTRKFSKIHKPILDSLGELERKTLEEVWRQKEVCVRDVSAAFRFELAYTTLMTTLDRLFKKGFLVRRKSGRAFLYKARYTEQELERGFAQNLIGNLLDAATGRTEPVLSCIIEAVSDHDLALLDELERLVQAKRLAIKSKE